MSACRRASSRPLHIVEPDFLGRSAFREDEHGGCDTGVQLEDPGRHRDNAFELALFEKDLPEFLVGIGSPRTAHRPEQ